MEGHEYALMDAAEDRMWWYRALHAVVLAAVGPLGSAGRVLDAGCGTGGLLARVRGGEAVGLEYRHAAAIRAAAKSGRAIVSGSVDRLPFADASFGTVVSLDVLCHATVTPEAALPELFRVLRPGGRLVLNLPAFEWLRSSHDTRVHNARRYTAGGIRPALEAAGFTGIESRYWNALLLPAMALHRKLGARKPDGRSDVALFPPWLDRMLYAVTAAERGLLRAGLRFPAGGSLLVRAIRPPNHGGNAP